MTITISTSDTFPSILQDNISLFGNRPAMRHKHLGLWQTWTWSEMADEIRDFALGLPSLGFKRGMRVAIIGKNRPRLYWAMTAVQSLGGIPVPLYADSIAEEMAYVLGHAEVTYAIVENQEQVDKLLSIKNELPFLERIIYDEPRGLVEYKDRSLYHFPSIQSLGRERLSEDHQALAWWHAEIDVAKADDLATILYTSGTTGRPKGVMLTYKNLVVMARNANAFDRLNETDEVLAYLPLAWIGDHVFSYAQAYCAGFCVCCPESGQTIDLDRREIGPTNFFAPPRIFELMMTDMMVRIEDASAIKRKLFHYFISVARRYGENINFGGHVSLGNRLLYSIGKHLIYSSIKDRFGLSKLRVCYTAGEAIGTEMFSFYRSLGINLKQLYGQTEATVYITMHTNAEVDVNTVGVPVTGVDIRISDNNEIQYRSPGAFLGYYNDPVKTAESFTQDGWVHTGDAGFIDDRGHLRVIDRLKDVGYLNCGHMFAPKHIENQLKFFPNIREAVIIGNGRDYCTVMINIDLFAMGNWAERNNVIYGSYQELAAHQKIYDLIASHIDRTNKALADDNSLSKCQIRRFLILHKELDADDGELTRTQKIRRDLIERRYLELVDALYKGPGLYDVSTEMTFENGKKGVLEGRVAIRDCVTYASST